VPHPARQYAANSLPAPHGADALSVPPVEHVLEFAQQCVRVPGAMDAA
jgi:hypothetical protein